MDWLLVGAGIVLVVGAVGWWVIRRSRQQQPPRERTVADIHREDAVELPQVRFTDDGDPTDSFIIKLKEHQTGKSDE